MARDLYLHVGASKSGTSSLQVGLRASREQLLAAGLGLTYASRGERAAKLLRPLGWEVVEGFPHPVDEGRLDRSVRGIRHQPGDRLMMTAEDLAELDEARVEALVGRLHAADLTVHVVVTIRDWTRTLPSDWQQQLKRRLTTDYPTYLAQVRDGEGPEAEIFRARQDLAGICARWGTQVPADRIHVVPVGGPQQDSDTIFREVASVVGVDHTLVQRPRKAVNTSYGFLECEVLRRLNVSLGDRLSDVRREYNPAVRRVLAKGALDRSAPQRVTLPPEHLGWVQSEMRRQVDQVRAQGVREHGDLDVLVPGEAAARPLPELDEAEVARVAIETLAAFAAKTFVQRQALTRDLRRARRQAERAPLSRPGTGTAPGSAGSRAGATVRRVVRRARRAVRG